MLQSSPWDQAVAGLQSRHAFSFLSWPPPATISPFQIFPEIPLTSKKWPVQESPSQALILVKLSKHEEKRIQIFAEYPSHVRGLITYLITKLSSVQFSHSVVSDALQPHKSQHTRPPCPSPTPRACSNPCSSSRWCHPAISSSVVPFSSCPQSLPASGSGSKF